MGPKFKGPKFPPLSPVPEPPPSGMEFFQTFTIAFHQCCGSGSRRKQFRKNQKKCWIFGTGTDKWLMVTIVILFKILMNGNFALSLLFCTFEQSLMFFKQMKTLHKAIKKKKIKLDPDLYLKSCWIRIR